MKCDATTVCNTPNDDVREVTVQLADGGTTKRELCAPCRTFLTEASRAGVTTSRIITEA
jgi:hypothetical protein